MSACEICTRGRICSAKRTELFIFFNVWVCSVRACVRMCVILEIFSNWATTLRVEKSIPIRRETWKIKALAFYLKKQEKKDTTTNMVKKQWFSIYTTKSKMSKTKNTNRDSREVKYQNETKQKKKKHMLTSFKQWGVREEKLTRSGAIKTPHLTVMKRNVTKTKSNIKEKKSNHYSTKKDPLSLGTKRKRWTFFAAEFCMFGNR